MHPKNVYQSAYVFVLLLKLHSQQQKKLSKCIIEMAYDTHAVLGGGMQNVKKYLHSMEKRRQVREKHRMNTNLGGRETRRQTNEEAGRQTNDTLGSRSGT